jgi:hypothetical protein
MNKHSVLHHSIFQSLFRTFSEQYAE